MSRRMTAVRRPTDLRRRHERALPGASSAARSGRTRCSPCWPPTSRRSPPRASSSWSRVPGAQFRLRRPLSLHSRRRRAPAPARRAARRGHARARRARRRRHPRARRAAGQRRSPSSGVRAALLVGGGIGARAAAVRRRRAARPRRAGDRRLRLSRRAPGAPGRSLRDRRPLGGDRRRHASGRRGTAVELAREVGAAPQTSVLACGPAPHARRGAAPGRAEAGLSGYASLEAHMACGTGACHGCVVADPRRLPARVRRGPGVRARSLTPGAERARARRA